MIVTQIFSILFLFLQCTELLDICKAAIVLLFLSFLNKVYAVFQTFGVCL